MAWHRTSRHERGYGTAWDKARQATLKRDRHLCQVCEAAGRVTVATEVDHITPKAEGGTDDMSNLAAICSNCHKAKTARENGRDWRVTGVDGWPLE